MVEEVPPVGQLAGDHVHDPTVTSYYHEAPPAAQPQQPPQAPPMR